MAALPVLVNMNYWVESIDDAAGEAFDKVAKMMKLPYPGGPNILKLHCKDAWHLSFLVQCYIKVLDFSFSGLKTSGFCAVKKKLGENRDADVAASFQEAIVDTLVKKIS